MRYGIFSDVHSNLEALEAVIKEYKKEAIDTYLCLGDVVGYAANPNECVDKVKRLARVTVCGNHDWASVGLFSANYFNPVAGEAINWTKHYLNDEAWVFLESLKTVYEFDDLTLVHGTLDNPADFNYMVDCYDASETFELLNSNVCFVGHTHVAGVFIQDQHKNIRYSNPSSLGLKDGNRCIVNVGSVGQPRDDNPAAAYCIYDTHKNEILIKRIGYDVGVTRNKIIDAGLPRFLGDRLIAGR